MYEVKIYGMFALSSVYHEEPQVIFIICAAPTMCEPLYAAATQETGEYLVKLDPRESPSLFCVTYMSLKELV